MTTQGQKAGFSIPSIIAVVAAIFSFSTGAFWGFVLACFAIGFGILGLVLSISPKIRGGTTSFIGIAAGLIGIIAALVKAIMWIF